MRVMGLLAAAAAVAALYAPQAQAITPLYSSSVSDCTTNGNQTSIGGGKSRWSISSGCDSYQNEVYERPTTQTYQSIGNGAFGASEYYQNLDIKSAQAGADDDYLYVAIEMVGLDNVTENGVATTQGLKYDYLFLLSELPDGADGYLLGVTDPANSHSPATAYAGDKAYGAKDTNGDVGGSGAADGLSITQDDDGPGALGNGYDTTWIGDGKLKEGPNKDALVLYARINPLNAAQVEFALDYKKLGFTRGAIDAILAGGGLLDFRAIKGGPKDPQNYMWNDEYTFIQAGNPYSAAGLGNIYEADTLRYLVAPPRIPEPTTWALMIVGVAIAGATLRRSRRAAVSA